MHIDFPVEFPQLMTHVLLFLHVHKIAKTAPWTTKLSLVIVLSKPVQRTQDTNYIHVTAEYTQCYKLRTS